jgi:hypothetical protein
MNDGSKDEMLGNNFTIGAYPELIKLKILKKQGYTAVISLLHPGVVPFEPRLIAQEQKEAKEVGIDLILVPMLPWIDDNLSSIDSLKKIVSMAKGKYYIHCYLGKDRVNVARRVIEEAHENVKLENKTFLSRNMDSVKHFERGPIIRLGDSVYFTPMPTKEEYFGYILTGNFKQVVSLADTANAEAKNLMKTEEKTVNALNIKFKVFRVNETTNEVAFKKIVDELKALPKPLVIHSFFSESKEAKMFLEAYNHK